MTLEELIETYPEAETYFKNMPEELKTRYTCLLYTSRFREITGAMAATAMYRTRYGIRPFLPEKYSTHRSP